MMPAKGVWSSGDVLVVAPLEAVWLTGSELQFQDGKGCLSFEVKGDNDATVLLKQQSGSRRWQHLAANGAGTVPPAAGRGSPVEQNYTIILGSHRNSCLKFEKDGELCCMVPSAPDAKLNGSCFSKYWINYDGGCISVGRGEPADGLIYSWTDAEPIEGIRFAGLSAWDKHVGYRDVRMHPPLMPLPRSPSPRQQRAAGEDVQRDPASAADAAAQPGAGAPSLFDCCAAALLRTLSPLSVCDVLQVADCLAPVSDSLRSQATEYAAQHFSAVTAADPEGFCGLSTECLVDILCSQSLDCREKAVFDSVMVWAGYGREVEGAASPCHPMQDLDCLLPCIRFPLMTDDQLAAVARHPMCARSPLLQELVCEALDARAEEAGGQGGGTRAGPRAYRGTVSVQDKRHVRALTASERLASSRFQLRRAPGCVELLYMFDGDRNGLCWHLGTAGGSQPWVNPVLAGRLQVRASSPACRSTDPKALAGGGFARCNFAGPRLEAGQLSSWWLIDLGPQHRLICNHYTLRHDASDDFLRSWVLQGSNDGLAWSDLRRHLNDRTIRMPGQYASWPVSSHAAAVPYRFFRLLLVGPNPEAANKHHVCVAFWELYGYLYHHKPTEEAAHDDGAAAAAEPPAA